MKRDTVGTTEGKNRKWNSEINKLLLGKQEKSRVEREEDIN